MMNKNRLSTNIINTLKSKGFRECSQNKALADAIAQAVIDEIKKAIVKTKVAVSSGSSAGEYAGVGKIE